MIDPDEFTGWVDRIQRERVDAGRAPTIQSPVVYSLLDALIANQSQNTK